jgi:hypothetical protein
MSEGCSNVGSAYADEGTRAHEYASQELDYYFFKKDPANGWLAVSDEMRAAVEIYTDFVEDEAHAERSDPRLNHILIEHRFNLDAVHPGLFGTADAVVYKPLSKTLVVADYKHGAGIAVDVEDNLQLMYYGLGALLSTGLPCETVDLVIVQPRCEHEDGKVRRWSFKSSQMLDFAADLAFDAAAVFKPDAPLNPGKHCRFCPAAPAKCPAIRDKANALAKLSFKADLPYDPGQLDQALRFLPAMEGWIKRVREFAYAEAVAGRTPPGWKLVEKRASRKWAASEEEITAYMADATKLDAREFYEEPKLKSPAQMEKLASKQINMGLRKMIVAVSSGHNLVPESDPRPAAKLDPQSMFTLIDDNTTEGE